jgi:hypothetical protein
MVNEELLINSQWFSIRQDSREVGHRDPVREWALNRPKGLEEGKILCG